MPATVRIEVRPGRMVRLLRAAILGLGVAGFVLAAWLAYGHEGGWILLALGAMMLWAGWRHAGAGLSWGTLWIGGDGRPGWQPEGREDVLPVGIERWFSGEKLVWLRLRGPARERHEVLLSRAALGDEAWRELMAWIVWLRRGA